ncbi:hypothetical protein B0H14DRAFT_3459923 [Mycena olivaceomarginata]|nr:hypothetical protein B0H14DRAFT_3459923 [Mycena olivaceomarginata]
MSRPARKRAKPATETFTHTATFSLADITGNNIAAPITTFVERASTDNRRRYREELAPRAPSHVEEESPPDRHEMSLGDDDVPPLPTLDPPLPRVVKPVRQDPALARFRANRDAYLANMLRRDGCLWPRAAEQCCECNTLAEADDPQLYRCKNCHGDLMMCTDCMVGCHTKNPLHRIEQWNGRYFVPSSLKALGLCVQLGHKPGERCFEAVPLHTNFVVLHTERGASGLERRKNSCCAPAGFLRRTTSPGHASTFEVLDTFVTQTYQAKTTMYDYYSALEKLTDNTGIKPPYRYPAFLRMVREYSHLLMLKRVGRGHAKSGVMGTEQGALANAPADCQFLYIIFLAIDACFRLKRRLVSSELKDPSLGWGWAYMVDAMLYRSYLLTITDQNEMSTCSGLAALDHANTKFSQGYAATGVGMGVCTRHEFSSAERRRRSPKGGTGQYGNMDFIVASFLRHIHELLQKIFSYDITLPLPVRLTLVLALCRFVIPKMHIKGHLVECQAMYSLELIPGSAQTCGEGIERPWAHIGGVGTSTREMGPGSREDTLNAHWGSWNWQKLVGLGDRLRKKSDRAKTEYATQLEAFKDFSVQQAACVPFEMKGLTEAQVLLQFEQEEAQRVQQGVPGIHAVSASSFVAAGLEVKDEQRRGRQAQQIDIVALRRGLNRSIHRLRNLQATYTPIAIVALGQRLNVPEDEQPENVPLFLPSALTPAQQATDSVRGLADIENKLGDAQCSSALERLRKQLHVKSRLLTYKAIQSRHQGANTRSRTLVERNESKIRLQSEKYQMAWEARLRLADMDREAVGWRVLRPEDIRCMEDAEELARGEAKRRAQQERLPEEQELGSARRRKCAGGVVDLERGWYNRCLMLIWKKVYAWSRRWEEEVRLVEEEVRRIGVALEYRACEWEARTRGLPIGATEWAEWEQEVSVPWSYERAEGGVAYGLKQAAMYRDIARRVTVSMTEVIKGRGQRRRMVHDDEWVDVRAGDGAQTAGDDDVDLQLEDLRADTVTDDDFILGGGADED